MKRSCGSCQECCYLLEIEPMDKGMNERCSAMAARGCSIYKERPNCCRVFNCAWLLGAMPKSQKPDRTGVVVWATQMTSTSGLTCEHLQANVRPGKHIPPRLYDWLADKSAVYPVVIKWHDRNHLLQDGRVIGEWRDENFVLMDVHPRPGGGTRVVFKGERLRADVLDSDDKAEAWEELTRRQISVHEPCPNCGNDIERLGDRVCLTCQADARANLIASSGSEPQLEDVPRGTRG